MRGDDSMLLLHPSKGASSGMFLRMPSLAAVACLAISVPLGAQDAPQRDVSGIVIDSVSGRALRSAVAYFDGGEELTAGAAGQFTFRRVSAGDSVFVVRAIGYVPRRIMVPPSSAASIDLGRIALRPVATRLDEIAVEAEAVRQYPQLGDFYRRKQEGWPSATFITRDDIRRSGARRTGEILQRSLKIQMDCPNVRVGDDACTARNMRGRDIRMAGSTRSRSNPAEGGTGSGWTFDRCEMDIFVDGRPTSMKVDEIPLWWIAGIEVHGSAATTPAAFGVARCGVVAIWTTGARG